MAKYYRGDTLPIVANYDGYTFQKGDIVTAGIFAQPEDDEEFGEPLAEVSVTVKEEGDEVQLEFTREQMHDIDDEVVIEVRTVTAGNVEMTVQKTLDLRRDGLR